MAASRWTARRRRMFLEVLAETGNVSVAARKAKVSRSHAYARRVTEPEFATEWDQAVEAATDLLEAEARKRALEGVETPHFHQGKMAGVVTRYSDALLMFLLKARRPEIFRDGPDKPGKALKSGETGVPDGHAGTDSDLAAARDALEARLDRLGADEDQADHPDQEAGARDDKGDGHRVEGDPDADRQT